jgi:hypothetical protein
MVQCPQCTLSWSGQDFTINFQLCNGSPKTQAVLLVAVFAGSVKIDIQVTLFSNSWELYVIGLFFKLFDESLSGIVNQVTYD